MPRLSPVAPQLIPDPVPHYIFHEIKMLAQRSKEEVCGFICKGTDRWYIKLIPNVHKTPEHAFRMDFQAQADFVYLALEDIAGVFHTHPSGSVARSASDISGFSFNTGWRYWIGTRSQVVEYIASSSGISPKTC